ncbi:hypothetical protein COO60DRAFT_331636 [Scenedesmus sp. NREL 46B-D3]|nr:hypothetical protein COO60DRAFT_331636 [Scenedesmus sp. NREL 46B-D3]
MQQLCTCVLLVRFMPWPLYTHIQNNPHKILAATVDGRRQLLVWKQRKGCCSLRWQTKTAFMLLLKPQLHKRVNSQVRNASACIPLCAHLSQQLPHAAQCNHIRTTTQTHTPILLQYKRGPTTHRPTTQAALHAASHAA